MLDFRGFVFVFALATGMRPSEYLALKWEDLDLERGVAQVRRSLTYKAGQRRFSDTKTEGSRRVIPLPISITRALIEYRKVAPESDLGLVFPASNGQPMIANNLAQRLFRSILKGVGLPPRKGCTTSVTPAPPCSSLPGSTLMSYRKGWATPTSR